MAVDPGKTGSHKKGDIMDMDSKWKKVENLGPQKTEQLSCFLENELENSLNDLERKLSIRKIDLTR